MLSQQPTGAVKHWMITCSCIICFIIDLGQFQPLNLFLSTVCSAGNRLELGLLLILSWQQNVVAIRGSFGIFAGQGQTPPSSVFELSTEAGFTKVPKMYLWVFLSRNLTSSLSMVTWWGESFEGKVFFLQLLEGQGYNQCINIGIKMNLNQIYPPALSQNLRYYWRSLFTLEYRTDISYQYTIMIYYVCTYLYSICTLYIQISPTFMLDFLISSCVTISELLFFC